MNLLATKEGSNLAFATTDNSEATWFLIGKRDANVILRNIAQSDDILTDVEYDDQIEQWL